MRKDDISLRITSDTRKSNFEVEGVGLESINFSAKMFDKGSAHGIDNGRISKLGIRKDGKIIVSFDRGWDVRPETAEHKAIYNAVMSKLNGLGMVFEQDDGKRSLLDRLDANKQKVAEDGEILTYSVEIKETLQKTVEVRAKSADEAELLVKHMYDNEEVILDESNFVDKEFSVVSVHEPEKSQKRGGEAL